MEQVNELVGYLTNSPKALAGAAVVIVAVLYLLARKPKTVREAERRMRQLRDEKADQYNKPRPIQ